jgi:hypothetical protein
MYTQSHVGAAWARASAMVSETINLLPLPALLYMTFLHFMVLHQDSRSKLRLGLPNVGRHLSK